MACARQSCSKRAIGSLLLALFAAGIAVWLIVRPMSATYDVHLGGLRVVKEASADCGSVVSRALGHAAEESTLQIKDPTSSPKLNAEFPKRASAAQLDACQAATALSGIAAVAMVAAAIALAYSTYRLTKRVTRHPEASVDTTPAGG